MTILSTLVAAIAAPIGAWVGSRLQHAKYEAEVEQLRAEMKDKLEEVKSHELENVRKASDILMESIVPPLKSEITKLRNDVKRLNQALERIWGCPHVDHCPVRHELLSKPKDDDGQPTEKTDNAYTRSSSRRKQHRGKARDDPEGDDGGDDDDGDRHL